ncbi:MAG TPA: nucleoside hydrolase [Anaerolineales bacterium]|nr:nucleoside hydrolase [Anaerolineales bacterium]
MNKKLVYVDTDVGLGTPGAEIDDGAALIFLMRNKFVEILGAGSVFGNVPLPDAALNLDRLLTWLGGEHIPMGRGAQEPLIADLRWFESWQSNYGKTLPWNSRPANYLAANLMIHTICNNPGQVSILSLGPMTNLALAIRLEPDIISLTREVIVMGGSFNVQNPSPEYNVRCDPEAAQIVFNSGWNVHVLGLDITRRVHFSRRDFASLPDGNPAVELLRAQAPGWIDRMEEMGWEQNGCALHDALAAAYLVDDTLFQIEESSVKIELANPNSRGITRFLTTREKRPMVKVITDVDTIKCHDLIWSHLNQ